MAGVDRDRDRDRDREPFRGDSYRAPIKSSGTKMDPPSYERDRFIPPLPRPGSSTSSSPYFANGDRRPPPAPPTIDTSRRASVGSGRRSVDASPRDVSMPDRYPPSLPPPARRNTRDDDDVSRFSRGPSRRDSNDRMMSGGGGGGSSAGAHTPASEIGGFMAPSPTISVNGAVPGADSMTVASKLIAEGSFSYWRLMEANKEYETARSEKMKYEAHFVDFPMMKERYGGAYTRAKEEQAKAIEEWKAKGQQIDLFFNTILRLIRDQRDQEEIARKAAENVVQERLPDAPGIAELREEMKALREETKKRDTEMDAYIKTAVGKIEAKQTFLNSLKTQMDDMKVKIQNLHNEVHDAEQLALAASDHMQKLTSLAARVEKFEEDLRKANIAMADIRGTLSGQKSLTNELSQRISALADKPREKTPPPPPPPAPSGVTPEDLEQNTKILKLFVEGSINDMAEECEKNTEAVEKVDTKISSLTTAFESLKASCETSAQKLHDETINNLSTLERNCNALGTRLKLQEDNTKALTMAMKHCDDRLSGWSTKDFYEQVTNMLALRNPNWLATGSQITAHGNQLTQHAERLQALHAQLQNQSQQLMGLQHQYGVICKSIQLRGQQRTQVRAPNGNSLPSTPTILSPSAPAPSPAFTPFNGSASAPAPAPSPAPASLTLDPEIHRQLTAVLNAQQTLGAEIEDLRKRFELHVQEYEGRMNDIREWTQGVSKELADQHEATAQHQSDIGVLRQYLRRQASPSSLPSPEAGVQQQQQQQQQQGERRVALWPDRDE